MEKEFAKNLLFKPTPSHIGQDRATVDAFCNDYRAYMDASKTERDAVRTSVEMAEKAGFTPYVPGAPLTPGQRIYRINREKSLMLAVIGSKPLSEGFRIMASHIDSPRLDLKPMPLYESSGIGYFKTHYYGGIKKYQWTVQHRQPRHPVHEHDVCGPGVHDSLAVHHDPDGLCLCPS